MVSSPRPELMRALRRGEPGQAFEDVLQHLHEQGLMHVAAFAQQPVDREQGRFLAVGGGVGHFHLPGRVAAGLQGHGGVHRAGGIALQGLGHDLQTLFFRVIAPEEETRVGGMVVAAVEIAEGLVGQVRDDFRVAAGVQAVEHVREDGLLALFGQHGIGRGVGALHLIVDHALVGPGAPGVLGLHVPAFLTEDVLADAGMEDGVDVDVDEVVEVLQVGAGHGIAGLVREGEGVEEGLERALEQLHEGFLDRIFVRAAEHGMFQDVGHAVESVGGVRKLTPKHLFSSALLTESSCAPVTPCFQSRAVPPTSCRRRSVTSSKP